MPLQNGEHLAQYADLAAHTPFGQRDDGKVLLAGDAGDEPVGVRIPLEPLLDHGAGVHGGVGVADVQGDVFLPDGENGSLVEHLGTAVAQLPQLVVGDLGNGLGILHNPGVRHEDAGYIGPVFVDIRVQSRRGQSAGNVAAAPGKGFDFAVGQLAVEAGNHHAGAGHQHPQGFVAGFLVHAAVKAELDPVRRVNELEAQKIRHEPGGEIFAPAGQFVLGDGFVVQLGLQGGKFRLQIDGQVQIPGDFPVAGGDHFKNAGAVHTVLGVGIAQIQKIRDFVVLLVALAGGGYDHHPAVRVSQQNVPDFPVLARVRHGGAAEFDYFHVVYLSLRKALSRERVACRRQVGCGAGRLWFP